MAFLENFFPLADFFPSSDSSFLCTVFGLRVLYFFSSKLESEWGGRKRLNVKLTVCIIFVCLIREQRSLEVTFIYDVMQGIKQYSSHQCTQYILPSPNAVAHEK